MWNKTKQYFPNVDWENVRPRLKQALEQCEISLDIKKNTGRSTRQVAAEIDELKANLDSATNQYLNNWWAFKNTSLPYDMDAVLGEMSLACDVAAQRNRDSMAGVMTPADISKAQELARECVKKEYKGC